MRLTPSSLFVLATAALVTADNASVNPPLESFKPIPRTPFANSVKPIVGRMTNAKRFAMKLPPPKPKAIKRGSLEVTFYASPDDPSPVELDLSANNGPSSAYPFVGASKYITTTSREYYSKSSLAVGFFSNSDNLGPGSSNYLFITGNTQTPAGSTPQSGNNNSLSASTGIPQNAESAVWKYNPTTQDISVQWINTDGSTPATTLLYCSVDDVLMATGDIAALQSVYACSTPIVGLMRVYFLRVLPNLVQTP
ncbi:hypothetical protein FS837_002099 [Tulasnella sp. UAMH 9824]|nr:hypothetical protein FS837_002099 [Tulasnella sp. UAMH 9824]